jgi:hypothetical protein
MRRLVDNATFVRAYMHAYDKITTSQLAVQLGYKSDSSGSDILSRAQQLRKMGLALPEWQHYNGGRKADIDRLNSIIAAHKIVDASPGLKKPPQI